jgi:hypothetical protein
MLLLLADGMSAAVHHRDFGTSHWQLFAPYTHTRRGESKERGQKFTSRILEGLTLLGNLVEPPIGVGSEAPAPT